MNAYHDVRLIAAQGFLPGAWQARCAACPWRGALQHDRHQAEYEGDEHVELAHDDAAPCHSCGEAPRAPGSAYCADCLTPEGPGAPPRVV